MRGVNGKIRSPVVDHQRCCIQKNCGPLESTMSTFGPSRHQGSSRCLARSLRHRSGPPVTTGDRGNDYHATTYTILPIWMVLLLFLVPSRNVDTLLNTFRNDVIFETQRTKALHDVYKNLLSLLLSILNGAELSNRRSQFRTWNHCFHCLTT